MDWGEGGGWGMGGGGGVSVIPLGVKKKINSSKPMVLSIS